MITYTSPNTIRVIKSRKRWAGHEACIEDIRNPYSTIVEKPENMPLGRRGRRWENNIKMDLK
jgi:hypothetical protein